MKKSEQRQNDILAFMKKTIASKGYSPTVREICAALGIKSTSTVHSDIKALEDKGLVKKDPAKPRTVLPVENEYVKASEVSYDTVALPVVGRVAAGTPILAEQNIEGSFPMPALSSSAGCSRLQKDAATITPAAKPVRAFRMPSEICFFRKKTVAAPRLVPRKGIRIPSTIRKFITISILLA